MQLKRLLILLAIFCGVLVVAIMGMYKSWNAFTSGGIFGMLSSKGIYKMVDGTSETVTRWWLALRHRINRLMA